MSRCSSSITASFVAASVSLRAVALDFPFVALTAALNGAVGAGAPQPAPRPLAADWGGMLFEPVGSYHPGSSKHPPRCSSSCASQGVRAAAAQPLILTASGPKRAKFRNRLTILGLSARFSRL